MNASAAGRAARRTQIWRRAHARLFAQPDFTSTLEASIEEVIRKKLTLGDDYASIELERAALDTSADHIEASQAYDIRAALPRMRR